MKKPIICHLCDFSPEYPGSFVDSLLSLARCCRDKMRIETFCFFPEEAKGRLWLKRFDQEGIQYAFVPRARNVIFDIQVVLQNYNPLIFHTHFFLFDISAVLLKFLFYRTSKIIWHYHNPTGSTFWSRIKDTIKIRFIARYLGDGCIAVGDGVYRSLIESGLPLEKLVLIHNSINMTRFAPSNEARKYIRESFGILRNQIAFLLLGWDPIRKGVDLFVKAADKTIQKNGQGSFFIIVGRDETREFVSKLSESSQFGPALRVIDPVEDFSLLLNGVDVLVSSSRSEGLSYTVLEAMAAGKLILCSDIPGVRETFGRSKGAWLFPTEDWKILSGLMKRAVEIPSPEREFLGQANSQYVKEHYSLEIWAERMGEVYSTLLR